MQYIMEYERNMINPNSLYITLKYLAINLSGGDHHGEYMGFPCGWDSTDKYVWWNIDGRLIIINLIYDEIYRGEWGEDVTDEDKVLVALMLADS